MSDVVKHLGQQIRRLRNERRMSQEELAFKAGISAAHLGQIERAVKNPTVDTVGKIASALGVPIASLFSDERATLPIQDATIGKITVHLSAMSEAEQKDILRVIRIFQGFHRTERMTDAE